MTQERWTPEWMRYRSMQGTMAAQGVPKEAQPQFNVNPRAKEYSFWQDPRRVVRYHDYLRSQPPGYQPPDWMPVKEIEAAYQYLKFRNDDRPSSEWSMLPDDDPGTSFLRSIPTPPKEFLLPTEADYAALQPEQPAVEPFGDWDNLETWQKVVQAIGSPQPGLPGRPEWTRLTAAMGQGLIAGLGGAGVGAAVGSIIPGLGTGAGALVGGLVGTVGTAYQAYTGQEVPLLNNLLQVFNILPQGLESAIGLAGQAGTSGLDEILRDWPAAYEASKLTYETMSGDVLNLIAQLAGDQPATQQQVWMFSRGLREPQQLQGQRGWVAINEARDRLAADEDPIEVYQDYVNRYGDTATFNDFIMQTLLDPTPWAGWGMAKGGGKIIKRVPGLKRLGYAIESGAGNPLIEALPPGLQQAAILVTGKPGGEGIVASIEKYRNWVRRGFFPKELGMDSVPAAELSHFEKWAGGLTEQGLIRELLPNESKNLVGYLNSLTPEAKAHLMLSMTADSFNTLMSLANGDPQQMVKMYHQAAGVDPVVVGSVGKAVLDSPITATIQQALRDTIKDGFDQELLLKWIESTDKREMLVKIANALGEKPADVLQHYTDNPDALMRRLENTTGIPGRPEYLKQVLDIYTGENPLPWTPDQFQAQLAIGMFDRMDKYLVGRYAIKPDSAVLRLSQTLKSMQSLLLLGLNPAYFINNQINNIATRAAVGVFGYMTPGQIKGFLDRFGITPDRIAETVTPEGTVRPKGQAILQAKEVGDALDKLNGLVNATNRKLGLFSRFSQVGERMEGSNAYAVGMKRFWSQFWRRDNGFRRMHPALEAALDRQAPGVKELIYRAVEAGMNMGEIEKAILGDVIQPQLDGIIQDAAREINPEHPEIAADMMRSTHLDERLGQLLANAKTPEDVSAAFHALREELQSILDEAASRELSTRAAEVADRVKAEGFPAALELFNEMQTRIGVRWLKHFRELEDLFEKRASMTKDEFDAAIRLQDEEDSREWQRINDYELATYSGIIRAISMDNDAARQFVDLLAQSHANWRMFFDGWDETVNGQRVHHQGRRDLYRQFFANYKRKKGETWTAFAQRTGPAWRELQDRLMDMYNRHAQMENDLSIRMNDLFGKAFAQHTGKPEEVARAWRSKVVEIRRRMQTRMMEFRRMVDQAGLNAEQRRAVWSQFLQEYNAMVVELKRAEIEGASELAGKPEAAAPGTEALRSAEEAARPQPAPAGEGEINAALAGAEGQPAAPNMQVLSMLDLARKYGVVTRQGEPIQSYMVNIINKSLREKAQAEGKDPSTARQYKTSEIVQIPLDEAEAALRAHLDRHAGERAAEMAKLRLAVDDILRTADAKAREAKIRAAGLMSRRLVREHMKTAFRAKDAEVEAVMVLMDLHADEMARLTGQTPSDAARDAWYASHIARIIRGGELEQAGQPLGLAQAGKVEPIRGATRFRVEDGRAVIRALQAPDVSTMVHEVGHIFRRDLDGRDLDVVARLGGLEDGAELQRLQDLFDAGQLDRDHPDWERYVNCEEAFARGWERYLAEGSAPTPQLRSLFQRFTDWFLHIYKRLRRVGGEVTGFENQPAFYVGGRLVSLEAEIDGVRMRDIFDRLLVERADREGEPRLAQRAEWTAELLRIHGTTDRIPKFSSFITTDGKIVPVEMHIASAKAIAGVGTGEFLRETKLVRVNQEAGMYFFEMYHEPTPEQAAQITKVARSSKVMVEFSGANRRHKVFDAGDTQGINDFLVGELAGELYQAGGPGAIARALYDQGVPVHPDELSLRDLEPGEPLPVPAEVKQARAAALKGLRGEEREYGEALVEWLESNLEGDEPESALPVRRAFAVREQVMKNSAAIGSWAWDSRTAHPIGEIPESGLAVVKVHAFNHGENPIAAAVYQDGEVVAYVPQGQVAVTHFDTPDGEARVLGLDPYDPSHWVVERNGEITSFDPENVGAGSYLSRPMDSASFQRAQAAIGGIEIERPISGGENELYQLDEQKWATAPQDQDIFGTVNNRLSKELEIVERLLGPIDVAQTLPGVTEGSGRRPQRSIYARDLGQALFDAKADGRLAELIDESISPETLADRRGYEGHTRDKFIEEVNDLRKGWLLVDAEDVSEEGGKYILSGNGKAGASVDLILGTCQPTAPCQECYAAASMIRYSTVRKALRNTIYMIADPVKFGQKIAAEVKKFGKDQLPFVRLLGSGDLTSDEAVIAFNELAKNCDRPIHIFSRHHENLARLEGTAEAPFIKMGSIDAQLYEYYGPDFLAENLEQRGINNAFLYTDESELPMIEELYSRGALGLVLSADSRLHVRLPKEIRTISCPCDAHERSYLGSCRQCALSQSGCYMVYATKVVDSNGKIWDITNAPSEGNVTPLLSFLQGFTAKKGRTGQAQAYSRVAEDLAKKSRELLGLYRRAFEKGEIVGIPMKDIRWEGDSITFVDRDAYLARENAKRAKDGKPLLRASDLKDTADMRYLSREDVLANLAAYIERLDSIRQAAKQGTFYLPGGEIQMPVAYRAWQRVPAESMEAEARWTKQAHTELAQAAEPVGHVPPGGTPVSEPFAEMLDEVIGEYIRPMLDSIQERYIAALKDRPLRFGNLDDGTQQKVKDWLKGVKDDMASTKYAAMSYGEQMRDAALLNYNRRYGFDNYMEMIFPYQFWYTRSMLNWAKRMIDRPSWYGMYARMQQAQERMRHNMPSRLQGKMRLPAPWLPEWAGGGIWFDPMQKLFTPATFGQPMLRWMQNQNILTKRAEQILKDMVEAEQISQADYNQAVASHAGPAWRQALGQAETENDTDASPASLVGMMMSPSLWWQAGENLLQGKPEKLSVLPVTRTGRALKTAVEGTPLEVLGNVGTAMAWPEEKLRGAAGLSRFGQWGDWYIDRQISNMAADGACTSDEARIAMIERGNNPVYQEAVRRVEYEQMLQTPGAALLRELASGNFLGALQSLPTTAFSSTLFPEGELRLRGLQDDYSKAWGQYRAGDPEALDKFFTDHPEYEARLALYAKPEDRLHKFLINEVWNRYGSLDKPNRTLAANALGRKFRDAFLNSETRSYDSIDDETLARWSQMLGGKVPQTPETMPAIQQPSEPLDLYPPELVQGITAYQQERDALFPNYYALQEQYYRYPEKSKERRAFLQRFPQLKAYWDWNRKYKAAHPELAEYWNRNAAQPIQQLTDQEISQLDPVLMRQVLAWGLAGQPMSAGARQMLRRAGQGRGMSDEEFARLVLASLIPNQ